MRLGDEGVEAGEQPAVPVCIGDPAAFFSVGGERLGVYPLGGEDGQIGGAGAEAGPVLADVGIWAGGLGGAA